VSDSSTLDADDVRLLRAIRDCPFEWAARPDIQQSPIDELRLYEMARYGYVTHVGERFLWKLTMQGRVGLAYHGEDKPRRAPQSVLANRLDGGDGQPAAPLANASVTGDGAPPAGDPLFSSNS